MAYEPHVLSMDIMWIISGPFGFPSVIYGSAQEQDEIK